MSDPRLGRLDLLLWSPRGNPPGGRCAKPCAPHPDNSNACPTCGRGPGKSIVHVYNR